MYRSHVEFGVHLGQQEPVVLEAADRLAEGLAVLGVLQCLAPGFARAPAIAEIAIPSRSDGRFCIRW